MLHSYWGEALPSFSSVGMILYAACAGIRNDCDCSSVIAVVTLAVCMASFRLVLIIGINIWHNRRRCFLVAHLF